MQETRTSYRYTHTCSFLPASADLDSSAAAEPDYTMVVQATDQGSDVQYSANITVNVHISRVNEFAPSFNESSMTKVIEAVDSVGKRVGMVSSITE